MNNKIPVPIGLLIKAWVMEYCKFHKAPYSSDDDWFKQLKTMDDIFKNQDKGLQIQEYILDYCISHRVRYFPRSPVILRMKNIITHNRE